MNQHSTALLCTTKMFPVYNRIQTIKFSRIASKIINPAADNIRIVSLNTSMCRTEQNGGRHQLWYPRRTNMGGPTTSPSSSFSELSLPESVIYLTICNEWETKSSRIRMTGHSPRGIITVANSSPSSAPIRIFQNY
jgi:hypothetical protein